jgi:hypothetical protein
MRIVSCLCPEKLDLPFHRIIFPFPPCRDVPVGGSVDVKASAEDWGEKQGYSLKADGVKDETRYVREEAGWDDDAANDEEIA